MYECLCVHLFTCDAWGQVSGSENNAGATRLLHPFVSVCLLFIIWTGEVANWGGGGDVYDWSIWESNQM